MVNISGSGNSENVIRAVDYGNANDGETLGLCGIGGGRLRERARHAVWGALARNIWSLQKLCGMK